MDTLKLTYAEAERAYLTGQISSDEWSTYRCRWRTSTVRFSTLASEHDRCGDICGQENGPQSK
jgi:hypothetical protein